MRENVVRRDQLHNTNDETMGTGHSTRQRLDHPSSEAKTEEQRTHHVVFDELVRVALAIRPVVRVHLQVLCATQHDTTRNNERTAQNDARVWASFELHDSVLGATCSWNCVSQLLTTPTHSEHNIVQSPRGDAAAASRAGTTHESATTH